MKIFSFVFLFFVMLSSSFCQPSLTYREKGIASFYAHHFHGLLTANGEIFNNYDFTAAHINLPFNTILLVTNLENGKSTVVRVNDRGPYAKKRIIDLSRPAARRLGMLNDGIINVDVQQLDVIKLSKEKQELFERETLLDLNGEKCKLKNVSVLIWDSNHIEHVMYMLINLKLYSDYKELYIQGKGSGRSRRYAIVLTNIKSKEEAKKIITKLKGEGYGKAKII